MSFKKKNIVYLLFMLLPLFVACSEDESLTPIPPQGEELVEILLCAKQPSADVVVTRVSGITFGENDEIGVFATFSDEYNNFDKTNLLYSYTNEQKFATTGEKIFFPVTKDENSEEATINAYYPRSENLSQNIDVYIMTSYPDYTGYTTGEQTYDNWTQATTDPLWAEATVTRPTPSADTGGNVTATLDFKHQLAKLKLVVTHTEVTKVTLTFREKQFGYMNAKTGVITSASDTIPAFREETDILSYTKTENSDSPWEKEDTFLPSDDAIESITVTKDSDLEPQDITVPLKAGKVTILRITNSATTKSQNETNNDITISVNEE